MGPSPRFNISTARLVKQLRNKLAYTPNGQFVKAVADLIWKYKWYSLIIFVVTIFQEFAALWPVNLLGDLVDRLESGNIGRTVWLFLAASLFYPAVVRANVILRHQMFYKADWDERLVLTLKAAEEGIYTDSESAGAAHSRIVNAVSGITNTVYHVLGSFTPVIIKITIVSSRLLAYYRLLGLVYLGSLVIPAVMTLFFNKRLVVLCDSQYAVISDVSGAGIRTILERDNYVVRNRFLEILRKRTEILIALLTKHQYYIYLREAALIGSQFLVVLLALGFRSQIGLTPGDLTKIIGYTAQVSAAFINAVAFLDNIVSYSRAYHVYATGGQRAYAMIK